MLHLIATLEGGGAERQLSYLAPELHRRGWEVTVGVLRMGVNAVHLTDSGVHIARLTRGSTKDPRNLLELIGLIRRFGPDLVQTWLPYMDIVGGLAATMMHVPWVASERTDPSVQRPHLRFRYRERRILGKAQAVIVNSERAAEYFRDHDQSGEPFFVANGLALEQLRLIPLADREALEVADDAPFAVVAGRLDPEKDMGTFVTALSLLHGAVKSAQAAIFGEGPCRASLEGMVGELGIANRVRFAGYVDNLPAWIKAADVVVSSSLVEGSPNVVLESMACGTPLVLSDIRPHRFLADGAALFFPRGDARALAECLTSVLEDPEEADHRAKIANERVAKFSVGAMTARYEEIYRAIMAGQLR